MKLTKFYRFLPDKAIDLVDEACSKLRLQQESKPEALENLDRQIMTIQIELESLKKETDSLSADRRKKLEEDLKQKQQESENLSGRWQEERYYNAHITHTVHSVHSI